MQLQSLPGHLEHRQFKQHKQAYLESRGEKRIFSAHVKSMKNLNLLFLVFNKKLFLQEID